MATATSSNYVSVKLPMLSRINCCDFKIVTLDALLDISLFYKVIKATGNSFEKTELEQEIEPDECYICFNSYDKESTIKVTLKCKHEICGSCCQKLERQICPFCRGAI